MKIKLLAVWLGLALGASGLFALDWEQGNGFRSAPLPVPEAGHSGFKLLPPERTGIAFTNVLLEERFRTNTMLLNGSGVAAGDVDGDGRCDLFWCGLGGRSALYRNLGDFRFEDATIAAGLSCPGMDVTGAAFADLDGDGDLDLVVNSLGHGTHIFLNDGRGHFTEQTPQAPLNPGKGGMSLALADIDGDGYLDLYVANYRTSGLIDMPQAKFWIKNINGKPVVTSVNGRPTSAPDLTNRFLVTAAGGIEEAGDADVLYLSQGGTNFVPVSFTGGAFLDEEGQPLAAAPLDWGLSVLLRDLNQDGLPDLYVCNDFDSPDRIWLNQGQGRFRALPRLALRKTSMFSMAMDVADINRDGLDDIFVLDMLSRDHRRRMNFSPERRPPALWTAGIENRPQSARNTLSLNRGDGTYAEIAGLSGLEASEWSWGCVFIDVDLDGWEDLLIINGLERDGRSMDVAEKLKALRANPDVTSAQILAARKIFPRLATAKLAFRNQRDLTFEELGAKWGFDTVGVSQGMALADLDNDGDLDVVVNNMNGAAGVYRNESSAPRVAVRLKGRSPNTRGIGARIKVEGGPVTQSQEMICGGRYLSSDDSMRVFAAGALTNELRLEVTWRSGKVSTVTGARPNRLYEVDEAGAVEVQGPKSKVQSPGALAATPEATSDTHHAPRTTQPPASAAQSAIRNPQSAFGAPHFEDVSALLRHTHLDEAFDDFEVQPLLPRKLSQLGPGVSWADLDGDGWDDLIIGSGKGGQLAAYKNDGHGGFQRREGAPFSQPVTRDQTTVLAWRKGPGQMVLLAGSANYEDGLAVGSPIRQYDLATKAVEDSFPPQESSTGPLALGDIDGDGNLDLFLGGRCLAGKYPRSASSLLFRNRNGKLEIDSENSRGLAAVGLVSGAVFSDLDGDGFPELVLACEWGPIKIFRNDHGRLSPWDPPITFAEAGQGGGRAPPLTTHNSQLSTLSQLTGWWNGVAVGDFDGDGRLDIVASNWGRNSRYQSHRTQPLQLYYGDVDGDGTEDIIEAYFDVPLQKLVPERTLESMAKAIPFLHERFTSHLAYGAASLEEILGPRLLGLKKCEAVCLESMIFLNRGNSFEARPLPAEAQMSPAFGICVGDFDGDGNEDIFLSQNFFGPQPETARYDAGRGLWLRGDGQGGFTPVAGQESGLKIYGEQRGCALADFDGDGRLDLVVAQNGAETKLYRNAGGRPGLRVRLAGPAGNPNGIGAVLRLGPPGQPGPAREIHAGAGYWSQDSAVQVMAEAPAATRLWVRWPGGKTAELPIPPDSKEVTASAEGVITRVR